MKSYSFKLKFCIGIFLILSCFTCFSQKTAIICGKIKSTQKFILHIYEPIHGYNNIVSFDTAKENSFLVNGIDSFYKVVEIDNPSFVKIYFTNQNKNFITLSDLLLFQGDSVHVNFDLKEDTPNSAEYSGSNATGQKLFNEINFQPINKYIPIYDILDELPGNKTSFISEIDSLVSNTINRFDSLRNNSYCSAAFAESMGACFRELLYNEVIRRFFYSSKIKELLAKTERDSIVEQLYKQQDPTDARLKGLLLSDFYICDYYDFLTYKKFKLNSFESIRSTGKYYTRDKKNYFIQPDFVPFLYIENDIEKQDLWAYEILLYSNMPGKINESTVKQFDSIFPQNKWKLLLDRQLEDKKIISKIEYKLTSPILFIDSTKEIRNFNELVSLLPKPIFVDLWATWCGYCIAAFSNNYQIDSFLLKNNISRLYISLDNYNDQLKWKSAIKKYALGGYHIIVRNLLLNDLKENIFKIKGNEVFGIPRYLIVDKSGKIVNADADSPNEFSLLKEQINNSVILK